MEEKDVTLRLVLEHVQAGFAAVDKQFDAAAHRFNQLEAKVDRNHRSLSGQINAIDKRLDAVEIEYLPKRVSRIEKHLGLAA